MAWQVSAGSLDEKKRLYRIFYKPVEAVAPLLDLEISIRMKKPEGLKDFVEVVLGALDNTDLDVGFRETCRRLLVLDPWLSYVWAHK